MGGACIAHDNRLAEYYHYRLGAQKFAAMAEKSLGYPVSIAKAQGWINDKYESLPTIFFDELVIASQPLIVHSKIIQQQIKQLYGYHAECLPFCIYNQFSEQELSLDSRLKVKAALGISQDEVAIVTMGIMHPTKAPLECIWTIARLRQLGINAHLYFVGNNGADLLRSEKHFIEKLGLQNFLHATKSTWVSEMEFRNYILAADFAIQLRKGPLGPVSGALQECVSAGLPVVSNENMVQSVEVENIAYAVPNELKPMLIADKIYNAYQGGKHLSRLSKERETYIEIHSFENYSKQILNMLKLS